MKKLMMAAAIVCAAALSQAAVVNWGADAQITKGDEVQAGITVNLFLANYDSAGNDLLIDSRQTTSGLPMAFMNGMLSAEAGAGQTVKFGENTVDGVLFEITNASQVYAVATSLDGLYTQTTDMMTLSGLSEKGKHTGTFTFGSTIGESGTGVWVQTVPEPTSGLLLLLGIAGLALKRRRA